MSAPRKFRRRAPRTLRRQPRLKVSAALSRELMKFADLLEVRPDDLLRWQLSDWAQGLNNPVNGMLFEWATEAVDYDTEEQTERVRQRVTTWLAQRSAEMAAKEAKGGQKP